MNTVVAPRTVRAETPERWAKALDRALHSGVEILTAQDGERFATSSSRLDTLYRVSPDTCDCAAGQAGDPVCMHRAALRDILGTLPVVTVRLDELIPADAPRCPVCFGKGERWAGSVDDERNPQRWIACPECDPDTHNDDAAIAAYEARLAAQEAAHYASLPAPDDSWTDGPSPYWSTAAGADNPVLSPLWARTVELSLDAGRHGPGLSRSRKGVCGGR